jgi:hypothetical protein
MFHQNPSALVRPNGLRYKANGFVDKIFWVSVEKLTTTLPNLLGLLNSGKEIF